MREMREREMPGRLAGGRGGGVREGRGGGAEGPPSWETLKFQFGASAQACGVACGAERSNEWASFVHAAGRSWW